MRRLVTAVILLPLIVAAIWWLPETALSWLFVVVFSSCAGEFARINQLSSRPWVYELVVAGLLVAALGLLKAPVAATHLMVLTVAVAALWMVASRTSMDRRATVGATVAFGLVYFVVAVRGLVEVRAHGASLLLLLVAMVAAGDTAAYYLGRAFGKRKMAETLSPNKTWVGFFASLAAATFLAGGWAVWQQLNVPMWLVAGAVTNLAAQGGDLLESAFKRQAGVKDSGDLLPGHGGIWDRVDAILLAAPAFAVMLPG